jgi:tetratricopeptide (TPR) repeat protein
MKLQEHDRLVLPSKSDGRPWLSAALVVIVICAAALATFQELRDYAKGWAFGLAEATGIKLFQDEHAAVYERLGIRPLPHRLLASSKVSSGLARLAQEPCDNTAIYAFGEALIAAQEARRAAEAYFAFATVCPNGEGEQNRAAQILFRLGDSEKVIAIIGDLIDRNPTLANYRYLRGRALANVRRYPEAVEDYKSAIQLYRNPRDVGEFVFVEMANIYVQMGRPCDAATTIQTWVAIDPPGRNTLQARKMVEEYSAKGCVLSPQSSDIKKL